MINNEFIKKGLGLSPADVIKVTKSGADKWTVRLVVNKIKNVRKISFTEILIGAGLNPNICVKCGTHTYCQPHHIIPKSAGGCDDPDNGVFLCFNCHVGNNGVHLQKWHISDIIPSGTLSILGARYGIFK